MRIAVLSDIHGNIWALEAALADLKQQGGVDVVINAGDILSGPLEPAATADLLMGLGLRTIAGNHERQLLACAERRGSASDQFAFDHTSARHHQWLASLPGTLEIGESVLVCHGTPMSDHEYFLEDVDERGVHPAALANLEARTDGIERALILCGHSHLPGVGAVARDRVIVNPGSVGLQAYDDDQPCFHWIENGSPHLRYAICERSRVGWNVLHRCVAYDHEKAAATARRHGREDWARWLETGRVT
jgi:putative phosphoesterase